MRAALSALALALAAGPGTILPPPTTSTTEPPVPSTTVTTERPTTTTTDEPSSSTTSTTEAATTTTSAPTTTAGPARGDTSTTLPGSTTTTEPGFVPPEGVAPGPGAGPAAPLRDAGTGALPLMVGLSIAGLAATAATMGVQWWRTRAS